MGENEAVEKKDEDDAETKASEKTELKPEKTKKQENKKTATINKTMEMTVKCKILRSIVEAVNTLSTEMMVNVKPTGWNTIQVDQAHVAMAIIDLDQKACESYSADEMQLGIDLEKFYDVLRLAKGDSLVSLTYSDEENCLFIQFDNLRRRMGLIDTNSFAVPKVPNLSHTVEATITSSEIALGLKASEQVSDHFAFLADKEKFVMTTDADVDMVELKWFMGKDECLTRLGVTKDAKSMYSIDFIKNELKVAASDTPVTVKYAEDNPMVMEYSLEDGGLRLKYLTAPRIESD